MSERLLDDTELLSRLKAISHAVDRADEDALNAALKGLERLRHANMTTQVRRVGNELQDALERFHIDSKLIDMAQNHVPDARLRLEHVLRLTGDAAHRTLDLVERSGPLAEHAANEAQRLIGLGQCGDDSQTTMQTSTFLVTLARSMSTVRSNLAEVLIAQGYQDLSGQIIRGVMTLIQELESALAELQRIVGPGWVAAGTSAESAAGSEVIDTSAGFGPQIPGIEPRSAVNDQNDVDALMSQMGV